MMKIPHHLQKKLKKNKSDNNEETVAKKKEVRPKYKTTQFNGETLYIIPDNEESLFRKIDNKYVEAAFKNNGKWELIEDDEE